MTEKESGAGGSKNAARMSGAKLGRRKEARYFLASLCYLSDEHTDQRSLSMLGNKKVCRRDHPLLAYKAHAQARRSSQPLEPPALLIHSHKFLVRPPSPRLGAETITVGSSEHTMLPCHSRCLPCIPRAYRAILVPTVLCLHGRHGSATVFFYLCPAEWRPEGESDDN